MRQEVKDETKLNLEVGEAETFVKTRVWKYLVEDMLAKALAASEENDQLDPLQQAVALARNQGAISALKWVVDMPALYAEHVRQMKEEEKQDDRA
ncbi:MAG: hypothetical protein WC455_22470 [Dehalococcoidia bacterium]|jgi:hypothetical protein